MVSGARITSIVAVDESGLIPKILQHIQFVEEICHWYYKLFVAISILKATVTHIASKLSNH